MQQETRIATIAGLTPSLILFLAIGCNSQSRPGNVPSRECERHIYERLRRYLDINEVLATHVVNNTDTPGRWQSGTQTLAIDGQVVEWIDQVGIAGSSHSVRINGELISLGDKVASNEPDDTGKFALNIVGEWRQIKLYKLYNQTILAIAMGPRQCTGLMCGVGAQLWFDVRTKQKTFFGTFRTDFDVRLFRFTNEEAFYVMTSNFQGDPHKVTAPDVITYELQKLKPDGRFEIQRNDKGSKYFLRHISYPDMTFVGGKIRKKKTIRADCLEQNWLERVLGEPQ
jgi:hypothetical protein